MTTPLPPSLPSQPKGSSRRGSLGAKLAIVGATGLFIGAAVVGLGGVASADDASTDPASTESGITVADPDADVDVDAHVGDGEMHLDVELSPEDEAVLDEFEQCLTDGGVDVFEESLDEDSASEADFEAIEAVFIECEEILEGLSEDAELFSGPDGAELSPEDEAIFDEFEECLGELESGPGGPDLTDEEVDALFAECEPILEGLSDDLDLMYGDIEACDEIHDAEELDDADDASESGS